jgi:hypothetical protein
MHSKHDHCLSGPFGDTRAQALIQTIRLIIGGLMVLVLPFTARSDLPSVATQPFRIVIQPNEGEQYEYMVSNSYVVSPDGGQVAFIRSSEKPALDAPCENMGLSI